MLDNHQYLWAEQQCKIIKVSESTTTLLIVTGFLLGPQINGVVVERTGRPAVLDLLGEAGEGFVNVFAILGADLEEEHVVPFGHLLAFLLLDLPLVLQVVLGCDQDLAYAFGGVALDLLDPGGNVLEGLLVIDGVGEDDASGALVVGLGDVPEPFLAGGVPDLQLDLGFPDLDGFQFEVDADGGHIAVLEDPVAELGQQVGLAHSAVANDDDLGQEVVLVGF